MNGFDNEFNFVKEFNRKKLKDLNPRLREIIDDIFYDISEEDEITCWRNHKKQKYDIMIRINGNLKGISIKMGDKNSVHTEKIGAFCDFLYSLGATKDIVKAYLDFHYGDGTRNGKGLIRLSSEQYRSMYQEEINILNTFLNTEENISKALDRFVLKGLNSDYEIDGLIIGTPDDFLWIKKSSIVNVLMQNKRASNTVHFSNLICQPLNRCSNYNPKYSYGRFYVQVKWYSLFDDVIESMVYKNFLDEANESFEYPFLL